MPAISMFFGLVVHMYFAPKEHNPPLTFMLNIKARKLLLILPPEMLLKAVYLHGNYVSYKHGLKSIETIY